MFPNKHLQREWERMLAKAFDPSDWYQRGQLVADLEEKAPRRENEREALQRGSRVGPRTKQLNKSPRI